MHVPACSSNVPSSYTTKFSKSNPHIPLQISNGGGTPSRPTRRSLQTVRFTPTPTVHILEQPVWEEQEDDDGGVAEKEVDLSENSVDRGAMADTDATAIAHQLDAARPQEDGTRIQDAKSDEDSEIAAGTEAELALEDIESDAEAAENSTDPLETPVNSSGAAVASTSTPEVTSEEETAVAISDEDLKQRQLASEIVKKAIGSAASIRSEVNAATDSEVTSEEERAVAIGKEDLEQRQLASEIVKKAIGSAVSIRSEVNAATDSEVTSEEERAVAIGEEDLEQRQLASEMVKKATGSAVSIRSEVNTTTDSEVTVQEIQPSSNEVSGDSIGQNDGTIEVSTSHD